MQLRATRGAEGHELPHDPQLSGLVWRLTQLPDDEQYVVPDGQDETQAPPEQNVPAPQRLPHVPQLLPVLSGASQPSDARLLQLP